MDGFVQDRKLFKTTPGVVAPWVSNGGQHRKVRQLLLQNLYPSLRMIAGELDISKDAVRKIVAEDLKKR
jgi:hypothetical protein